MYKGFYVEYQILLHTNNSELILKALEHSEITESYNDEMLPLFRVVADKYNCNLERLVTLAKISGCEILQAIGNKNIQSILNYSDEEFSKFIKIFSTDHNIVDVSTQSTILNSLLQRNFSLENPGDINIFANTSHAAQDGDYNLVVNLVSTVCNFVNIEKYSISINEIVSGIISGNESIIILYNNITKDYIELPVSKG